MIFKEINRNVHMANIPFETGEEFEFLLCSDVHFDSKGCLRDLWKKHLKQAKEKIAPVFLFGDAFDVMGANRDPRSKPGDIRPEYYYWDVFAEMHGLPRETIAGRSYLDLVAMDFSMQCPNITILGRGNHETSIQRHHDVDLIGNTAFHINNNGGHCFTGGYSGYIILQFFKNGSKRQYSTFKIHYYHGHGSAKRSKNILRVDLDAARFPDADLIVHGHSHHSWKTEKMRERITAAGRVYDSIQHHVSAGHYKDTIKDGYSGYEVEKDYEKSAPGGYWLKIKPYAKSGNYLLEVEIRKAN